MSNVSGYSTLNFTASFTVKLLMNSLVGLIYLQTIRWSWFRLKSQERPLAQSRMIGSRFTTDFQTTGNLNDSKNVNKHTNDSSGQEEHPS
jgi:hypothetical protein